jgi:hypothetical protein
MGRTIRRLDTSYDSNVPTFARGWDLQRWPSRTWDKTRTEEVTCHSFLTSASGILITSKEEVTVTGFLVAMGSENVNPWQYSAGRLRAG